MVPLPLGDEKFHHLDCRDAVTGGCMAKLTKLHTSKYRQFVVCK